MEIKKYALLAAFLGSLAGSACTTLNYNTVPPDRVEECRELPDLGFFPVLYLGN